MGRPSSACGRVAVSVRAFQPPASGPCEFSVEELPEGLTVDSATGRISGTLKKAGVYKVVLRAKNARGTARKEIPHRRGRPDLPDAADGLEQLELLGGGRRSGQGAAVRPGPWSSPGLIDHGWTYVNIDDTWQGRRGGPFNGIQGNQKFPDMKELCDEIHAMGLKPGIYSTPWITSYAKFCRRFQRRPGRRLVGGAGQRQVLAARQVFLRRRTTPNNGPPGVLTI